MIEILDKIEKPIRLEARSGFKDRSTFGGLESYVRSWIDKADTSDEDEQTAALLGSILRLISDYGSLNPKQREDNIGEIIGIIEKIRSKVKGEETRETQPVLFDFKMRSDDQTSGTKPIELFYPPADEEISRMKPLFDRVSSVKGIGRKREELLARCLSIETILDVIEYFPVDYIDRTRIKPIYQVGRSGEPETIQGRVVEKKKVFPRRGDAPKINKIIVYDESGFASLVGFGRMGEYLEKALNIGDQLIVSGRFKRAFNEIQTSDFEYEKLSDEDAELIHTGRIVPKYRLAKPITQRNMRFMTKAVIDQFHQYVPEFLSIEMRKRLKLMDKRSAILNIHFPETEEHLREARRRLIFEEFFFIQLWLALRKRQMELEKGIAFDVNGDRLRRFLERLPFELTGAQKRVIGEILADMSRPHPMNRLIQGDVGSGKTIVAAAALVVAVDNGYQGAMMAPTEILAEQHFNNLDELLEPLGIRVVLLRGDMRAADRRESLERIESGEAQIIIGTHALIQEGVTFHNLGLIITDEQHRFGVLQRAALKEKGGMPDTLVMTATPIPRTLALTVYGDLDLSIIDEMPPGRRKIRTYWIREEKREQMYDFLRRQIRMGRQAYVVYPLIEESEKLEDIKAATEMSEHLQNEVFPELRIGLLHGRLTPSEKQEIMRSFKEGEIDILVSTTVVEVGVDVANATVMVIEHAERFGLAQLHQLRGRVGRSDHQSYCFLVATPRSEDGFKRLQTMVRTTDGFEIAEADLEIRGPGELTGVRQSGMPDLKIANLARDVELLTLARREAQNLVSQDPSLSLGDHKIIGEALKKIWRKSLKMIDVG